MEDNNSTTSQRMILGGLLGLLLVGGLLALWFGTRSDEPQTLATEQVEEVEEAGDNGRPAGVAAAAQAQARREAAIASAQSGDDAASDEAIPAASSVDPASSEAAPEEPIFEEAMEEPAVTSEYFECGYEEWEPTAEEIAASNADNDEFAAFLTLYGVEHEVITDEYGFAYVEYDYENAIDEIVANSFWENRYPPEPIDPEYQAQMQAENDGLAAAFDAAGIAYERISEDGYEWIEFDYENPAAQEVADAYYMELYPPEPIDPEYQAEMRAENDGLAAAFDAAGIAYERISDDYGYEWIDYDYDDEAANEVVHAYYLELYPPVDCEGNPIPEGEFEGEIAYEENYEIPEEELAAIREENAALAAVLEENGIAYEIVVEEDGWEWVEFDYEDEAAQVIVDEFYGELYGPDEDYIANRTAAITALQTSFDAAGVAYEVDGEDDWLWMTFDSDNPAAPAAVAEARATL